MKTVFYLNGQRITRKALSELIGAAAVRRLVMQAKETHFVDPLVQNDFFLGSYGIVTICFV